MLLDNQGNTPIMLAANDRIKEIITCYFDQNIHNQANKDIKLLPSIL
jgi:hypothetical protein